MRTILIFLSAAGIANAAPGDVDFQKAAEMMVDRDNCHIPYEKSDLADHLIKGSLARGVSQGEGASIAASYAVALTLRINSSVGVPAYCSTRN